MIRTAIKARLCKRHAGDDNAFIVEELPVERGDSRVDVAIINGHIEGVEIKSSLDTLERLPRQVDCFGQAIEKMTLIVAHNHIEKASRIVPDWWTILQVHRGSRNGISFERIHRGTRNPNTTAEGYVNLLRRDEIVELLAMHGLDRGVRTATWPEIADRAMHSVPLEQLSNGVRLILKARALTEAQHKATAFGISAAGTGLVARSMPLA